MQPVNKITSIMERSGLYIVLAYLIYLVAASGHKAYGSTDTENDSVKSESAVSCSVSPAYMSRFIKYPVNLKMKRMSTKHDVMCRAGLSFCSIYRNRRWDTLGDADFYPERKQLSVKVLPVILKDPSFFPNSHRLKMEPVPLRIMIINF